MTRIRRIGAENKVTTKETQPGQKILCEICAICGSQEFSIDLQIANITQSTQGLMISWMS